MRAIAATLDTTRRVIGRDAGSTLWRRGKRPGRDAPGSQMTTLEDC
jgi:hypothetical protein